MKLTPRLRFPEFTNDWVTTRIKNISQKGQYGMNAASKTYDGINKYLRITDIDEESRRISKSGLTSPNGILENKYLLFENDVVFTRTGASTGKTYLYDAADGRVYFAGFLIKFHIDGAVPGFIFAQTLRESYSRWVITVSTRSGQPGINAEEYGEYKFYKPDMAEQQKIVDFLTTVDNKITALDKKVELLKQYKKGVMQQIFSQQVRFKDENGQDYPEWDITTLGELGKFYSGQGFSDKEQGGKEGTPFFKVSDMNTQGNESKMTTANHYVTDAQVARLKYKVMKSESIIFAKVGAAIFLERKRIAQNYILDNNMMSFTPTEVSIEFMRHVFSRTRLSKFAQVGALPSYNSSDLSIIKLAIPTANIEQQKISNLLTTLDEKITAEQTRLGAAKEWKKGLMQRMFI